MTTHSCGVDLPEGARFCPGCGAQIAAAESPPLVCSHCGVLVMHHLHISTGEGDPCSVAF